MFSNLDNVTFPIPTTDVQETSTSSSLITTKLLPTLLPETSTFDPIFTETEIASEGKDLMETTTTFTVGEFNGTSSVDQMDTISLFDIIMSSSNSTELPTINFNGIETTSSVSERQSTTQTLTTVEGLEFPETSTSTV